MGIVPVVQNIKNIGITVDSLININLFIFSKGFGEVVNPIKQEPIY